ncbi:class I SAM-dependent DNA methyltransferase [Propionivibrio sp.]|uniref:class I SAM-dependent DNA methyltransferase n=1 Tax=Propionivibrio sp. TaxID=2212460 RepID=UPI003BEF58D4
MSAMTPERFISIWKDNDLNEEAGAQAHFEDLCDLLGVPKPRNKGDYCYERKAAKAEGKQGYADVWMSRHFGWENKAPGENLKKALAQLKNYSGSLGNPPLLIVCDRLRIEINVEFQYYPTETHSILIHEIGTPENLQKLKWVFTDPQKLRPERTIAAITTEAAEKFSNIAKTMRERGLNGQHVAHFLVQCLFCMFAEDENLLPEMAFTKLLEKSVGDPERAANRLSELFKHMKNGGDYGDLSIAWFNGGLFKTVLIPHLIAADLSALHRASADMDWRAIDPTIFGTLFERGLDPEDRAPLGAHYTDIGTIGKLINPLISEPLTAEWESVKQVIATEKGKGKGRGKKGNANKATTDAYQGFMLRLNSYRVLDPACGSGNFLYLALKALRDIEKQVHVEAQEFGIQAELAMQTGPHNILGIEINEFAAELARVTVWIGDIQWCRRNGYQHAINPILQPLDSIEHRDALLNKNGSEAKWPKADVIVGNPPFLGDKIMRGELGDAYVNLLRNRFEGRVPGGADLVIYWFEKSRAQIEAGLCQRAGLVATNSIRQKRNRVVLERILESTQIFEAWSDEDWINEGAAVRVSLVCYGQAESKRLDGNPVAAIFSDLTGSAQGGQALDLTQAKPLLSNKERSYFGICLAGPFKVDTATALAWLKDSGNPNGRPNSDVVRPIYNGSDVTRRWADNWVIDFAGMEMTDAADFLAPFAYIEAKVKPLRSGNREASRAERWWRHGRYRPELRAALHGLTLFIATSETAKHRFFIRLPVQVAPEHRLIVIPRQDDATLGILSSRIHCVWALAVGGSLEDRPVYNSSLCFEMFPFPPGFDLKSKPTGWIGPQGVTQDLAVPSGPNVGLRDKAANPTYEEAIARTAADLDDWREKWLNPEGWLDWEITPEEQTAGFPPRPVPKTEKTVEWKKRTLTNLYNEMPTGLKLRQEKLDKAVAAAYGWTDYSPATTDDEILRRLLAMNLAHKPTIPTNGDDTKKSKTQKRKGAKT